MNCSYHSDREVVAACTECGRFICEECKVNINGKAVCKNRNGAVLQRGA